MHQVFSNGPQMTFKKFSLTIFAIQIELLPVYSISQEKQKEAGLRFFAYFLNSTQLYFQCASLLKADKQYARQKTRKKWKAPVKC